MAIHVMGNPLKTVLSCYSPTNVSDQEETERFYVDLTSYTRHIICKINTVCVYVCVYGCVCVCECMGVFV